MNTRLLKYKLWLSCLLIVIAQVGYAAADDDFEEGGEDVVDEGPPQEPPYTQGGDEFSGEILETPEPVPKTNPKTVQQQSPAPTLAPSYAQPSSPQKAREFIHHPNISKGLIRIEKDGSYIYRPQRYTERVQTGTLRVGVVDPIPKISGSTVSTNSGDYTPTYQDIYGNSKPTMFTYDYEWMPLTSFGKLGVVAGAGFFTSSGKGRFVQGKNAGQEAREAYTFYGIPLNLGVSYRFEYVDRQWIAPYIMGGGSLYMLAESRDDGTPMKYVGVWAGYGAAGGLINISAINSDTAFALDNEYGIANLWLSIEYRYVKAARVDLDVSASIISFGIAADY